MSLPPYTPEAPTKEHLDYVKLVNLDLAKFDDPVGRQELARELYEAASGYGFLTLTNHGLSDEVYAKQMQIANAVMSLPPEEKASYEATPEEDARGVYVGFKPAGSLGYKGGFPKHLDNYNILVDDPPKNRPHPEIMRPYMGEIYEVMHFIRDNILKKLLTLMAMVLQVPDEVVQATHERGGSYYRYQMCEPCSEEESAKYRDLMLSGHTDWGSWTFLFSQPVAALQVLDHTDGKFRWVEHQPKGIVVNAGTATSRLTGGLFKATIHRLVQPPRDQRHLRRIGVIYFARPADDLKLVPIEGSPLLQSLGADKPVDDRVFCMADYADARKHGLERFEYDTDRPTDPAQHADFYDGQYPDPEGHKSLGKFDNVPRDVYVPTLKA
ncbi:gibberellin 2-oxidase [Xylariaceae sp. FL0662B]|nr:gibberellin 2-oxidase [Xylariaceae sp. FL0662B]